MRILAPKEYASLPKLEAPAGYICVLRDIDRSVYRIDSTDHPAVYVDRLLAELKGRYGLELLSILETDDIGASETLLYERYHAALGENWLELDAYQLRALRKSELRILDYSSHYISPRHSSPGHVAKPADRMSSTSERSATGQTHGDSPHAPSLSIRKYYHVHERRPSQREAHQTHAWRQTISDRIDDFLHNHPGLVIAFMLFLMLLILIHYWRHPYPY